MKMEVVYTGKNYRAEAVTAAGTRFVATGKTAVAAQNALNRKMMLAILEKITKG